MFDFRRGRKLASFQTFHETTTKEKEKSVVEHFFSFFSLRKHASEREDSSPEGG